MKLKTILFAAAAALALPAVALANGLDRPFSDADQFDAFYQEVVAGLTKSGAPVKQTCFRQPSSAYCSTWMSWAYKDVIVAALNNHFNTGIDQQEVCYGGATTRRCAFSNGFIVDQRLEGHTWVNTQTVADGYAPTS